VSEVHDISRYAFTERDHLFIDTSVWYLVNGPAASRDTRTLQYSSGLSRARQSGSKLYTDVLILSEFMNRYARFLSRKQGYSSDDFKRFRQTTEWSTASTEIAAAAQRILKRSICISTNFENIDHDALMSEFETGSLDFNDQVLTRLCKVRNLTFVTDDGDFVNSGLDLITGNKRLLASA